MPASKASSLPSILLLALAFSAPSSSPLAQDSCPLPGGGEGFSGVERLAQALKDGSFVDGLKQQAPAAERAPLLDATFLYEFEKKRDALGLKAEGLPELSAEEFLQVHQLFWITQGVSYPGLPAPANFPAYLKQVEANADRLSPQAKLLLLSLLGEELARGYDFNQGLGSVPLEQLFQNMRQDGNRGGVCREIHAFLAEVAKRLGFTDVGLHTGLLGRGNDTGAHAISYFKDPKTGEYYIQNYQTLINTRQKTVQAMTDISTRVLAPLAATSYVESLPGAIHLYRPRIGRWVRQQIEASARHEGDRPALKLLVGNVEQLFDASIERKLPSGGFVKGFFVHSRYAATEGPYQLNALGVAKSFEKVSRPDRKYVDELSYASHQYLGAFQLEDPLLIPDGSDTKDVRKSIFAGFEIVGTARRNQLTGKLELKANILDAGTGTRLGRGRLNADLTAPDHAIRTGLAYDAKKRPLRIEVDRTLELGPKNVVEQTRLRARTAYDRIHVVLDARSEPRKAYVISESGAYVFEGAEKMSAIALRETLKAGIERDRLGEFAVVLDASRMVSNRSGDPYYRIPDSVKLSATWEKAVNRMLRLGSELLVSRGPEPFFVFEQPGTVVPELTPRKNDVAATVWTRVRF